MFRLQTITRTASPSAIVAAGTSWVVTFTGRQPSAGRVRSVTESSRVRQANPDPVAANDAARLTITLH